MNKHELSDVIAKKTSIAKKDVEAVVEAALSSIVETLKAGGEVTLTGFGTFLARVRPARMGVNPQRPTEKIKIPEVVVPKFKAGKALKDALKNQ